MKGVCDPKYINFEMLHNRTGRYNVEEVIKIEYLNKFKMANSIKVKKKKTTHTYKEIDCIKLVTAIVFRIIMGPKLFSLQIARTKSACRIEYRMERFLV